MKYVFGLVILVAVCVVTAIAADPPGWAYGFPPAGAPAAAAPTPGAPDTSPKKLSGAAKEFTRAQISDGFGPADWFPGDHPAMPPIVAYGKRPDVRACSLCHYPNGKGRAENAGVSGLPTAYFIQQMMDFRNGLRKSAEPRKNNTNIMIAIAKGMTEDEIKAAAEYFGSIKWTPWIKVVETAQVPKTRIQGGLFLALEGNEKEALGNRIIEVPEDAEATEVLRNPRSGFFAYAPVGSVKKGEALANTKQCAVCHGPGLKGLGPVPPLAGRSPSYLMRQMFDMQQGARKGVWSELMKPVVTGLTEADLLTLSAYAASLAP